jgi:hypothetical protein
LDDQQPRWIDNKLVAQRLSNPLGVAMRVALARAVERNALEAAQSVFGAVDGLLPGQDQERRELSVP